MAQEKNRSGVKAKKQRRTYLGFSFKLSFRLCVDKNGAGKAVVAEDVVETEELSV